jgi:hypothetical protein
MFQTGLTPIPWWENRGQEHVKKLILPISYKLFFDWKCIAKCQKIAQRASNHRIFLGMSSASAKSRFFHMFQTGLTPIPW